MRHGCPHIQPCAARPSVLIFTVGDERRRRRQGPSGHGLSEVDSMLGPMKRDLVVAGKAIGGASLTGAVLYLVATAPTHVHVYWPYWVFLAAVLVGMSLYLAGQERGAATKQAAEPTLLTGQPARLSLTAGRRPSTMSARR
jgi:hypothetical protein